MKVYTNHFTIATTDTLTKPDLNTNITTHCQNTSQFKQHPGKSLGLFLFGGVFPRSTQTLVKTICTWLLFKYTHSSPPWL